VPQPRFPHFRLLQTAKQQAFKDKWKLLDDELLD
jgi:hypothetical protein